MTNPVRSADRAGLVHVSDDQPGIRRRRCGRGFGYLDPEGNYITDPDKKARFKALAIPPAYTDVWICLDPDGHLQATGRDEEGRKQYIYHAGWEQVRQRTKFNQAVAFGEALPDLRARLMHHLAEEGMCREKVIAAAIQLMDRTLIRVGNDTYTRRNGSYGLTTLQDEHVDFKGGTLHLVFTGKGGKDRRVSLDDAHLAELVRACRDLPGQRLFQYLDADGVQHPVHSDDVNAYLKEVTGADFTAKDFRTWGATVQAAAILGAEAPAETEQAATQQRNAAIGEVAERLGNTKAVCRDHYIHPDILSAFSDGSLHAAWQRLQKQGPPPRLARSEYATLQFLQACDA
jgi:DNA topoisomerase-1